MTSTRSKCTLPDHVIHAYPEDRKKYGSRKSGKILNLVGKSTQLSEIGEFEEGSSLVTSTPYPKNSVESIDKTSEKSKQKVESDATRALEREIKGLVHTIDNYLHQFPDTINPSFGNLDANNPESGNPNEKEVEVVVQRPILERTVINQFEDSESSFTSATGQTTPWLRLSSSSGTQLRSRSSEIVTTPKRPSLVKSRSKSISPRRKSAPSGSENFFVKAARVFGIIGDKHGSSVKSKKIGNKSKSEVNFSSSFNSFTRLASLTEKPTCPRKTRYTANRLRSKSDSSRKVKVSRRKQIPKEVVRNLSEKMAPVMSSVQRKKISKVNEKVNTGNSGRNSQKINYDQIDEADSDDGRGRDHRGSGGGGGDGGGDGGDDGGRGGGGDDNPNKKPFRRTASDVTRPVLNMSAGRIGNLRDALQVIPQFDGNRSSLDRYIAGLEDGLELVGIENELHLLRLAKSRLVGDVWNRVAKNKFESIDEYIEYLKTTYDPPRDIYQLQGELGSCAQLNADTVDQYAHRVRELAEKINEAHYYKKGYLGEEEQEIIDEMACSCFRRGLKPEIRDKMGKEETTLRDAIHEAKKIERELADLRKLRENAEAKQKPEKEPEKTSKKASVKIIEEAKEVSTVAVVNTNTPAVNNCQICGKKGHLATSCWSAPGAPTPPSKCQICGKLGHTADKCKISGKIEPQNPLVCQYCQKSGHSASNCFKIPGAVTQTNTIMICQICGKRGHTADKCYSNPCRNCGRKGHLTESCRNVQQSVQNQTSNFNQVTQQNQPKIPQGQTSQIQCQVCNGWGHSALGCNQQKQGNIRNSNVAGLMSYSQALAQHQNPMNQQNLANQIICNYCKSPGHYLADCQIRISNNNRRAAQQGNADGRPAQGAQAQANVNTQAHPTLTIKAFTDSDRNQK